MSTSFCQSEIRAVTTLVGGNGDNEHWPLALARGLGTARVLAFASRYQAAALVAGTRLDRIALDSLDDEIRFVCSEAAIRHQAGAAGALSLLTRCWARPWPLPI